MTTTLKNNAFVLDRAIRNSGHCEPGSALVRDGHHKGTLFTWLESEDGWCVVNLEQGRKAEFADRLAVVSLDGSADADGGLNTVALGFDMECGEWVVDAGDLGDLIEQYGDALELIWEQAE